METDLKITRRTGRLVPHCQGGGATDNRNCTSLEGMLHKVPFLKAEVCRKQAFAVSGGCQHQGCRTQQQSEMCSTGRGSPIVVCSKQVGHEGRCRTKGVAQTGSVAGLRMVAS